VASPVCSTARGTNQINERKFFPAYYPNLADSIPKLERVSPAATLIRTNRRTPEDARELLEAQEAARKARDERKEREAAQRRRRAKLNRDADEYRRRNQAEQDQENANRSAGPSAAATRIKKRKAIGQEVQPSMQLPGTQSDNSDGDMSLDIDSDTSTEFIWPKKIAKSKQEVNRGLTGPGTAGGSTSLTETSEVIEIPDSPPVAKVKKELVSKKGVKAACEDEVIVISD
jgi:hypothetical protein